MQEGWINLYKSWIAGSKDYKPAYCDSKTNITLLKSAAALMIF